MTINSIVVLLLFEYRCKDTFDVINKGLDEMDPCKRITRTQPNGDMVHQAYELDLSLGGWKAQSFLGRTQELKTF